MEGSPDSPSITVKVIENAEAVATFQQKEYTVTVESNELGETDMTEKIVVHGGYFAIETLSPQRSAKRGATLTEPKTFLQS